MAASKKQVQQAKQMAAAGKSAQQILNKTGVSENRATTLANKARIETNAAIGSQQYATNQAANMAAIAAGGVGGTVGSSMPAGYQYSGPSAVQDAGGGSVRDQLKVAGANGNISKNELMKIAKTSDIETDRVIRQLDKLNEKGASKGVAPIGLGSAAYNSLLKEPTSRTIYGKTMTELGLGDRYADFGKGGIGQAITQGKGTSDYYGNATPGTGKIPQGQQVFGSFNSAPQVQTKPQNVVNAGYFEAGPATKPIGGSTKTGGAAGGGAVNTGASSGGYSAASGGTTTEPPTSTTAAEAATASLGAGMMAGGGLGAAGAAKLGRARSRLQRLGILGRGTGLLGRGLQYGNSLNA